MTPWSQTWWAGPLALAIFLAVLVPAVVFGVGVLTKDVLWP